MAGFGVAGAGGQRDTRTTAVRRDNAARARKTATAQRSGKRAGNARSVTATGRGGAPAAFQQTRKR
jgi:hypothetical protein